MIEKLACVKSDSMDDWFTIEHAEHDGRQWMEPTTYGARLCYSGRISDACVEGTAAEMLAIALAIESRTDVHFRRCAVRFESESGALWSPRNSETEGVASLAVLDELAADIRRVCTP